MTNLADISGSFIASGKIFFSRFFVWFFVFFCFVYGCFESRSGYKDRPIRRFSPSPSVVWRSVLWPGDWRILLLCIYIPAPFTESFDRLGRRMIFKVAGAGIELRLHSSSWPRAPYPLDQRSFPILRFIYTIFRLFMSDNL